MAIPEAEALSPSVRSVLKQFVESLTARLQDDLTMLALYGGLARGNFDEHSSDLNLLLVLRETSPSALDEVAAALTTARRGARVRLITLAESELPECVEVFATKFFDIQRRHILLHGRDVLAALLISPERLVRQARRELVNLKLRVRQTYLTYEEREEVLEAALERARKTVKVNLSALEELGQPGTHLEALRACLPTLEPRLSGPPVTARCLAFLGQLERALHELPPV